MREERPFLVIDWRWGSYEDNPRQPWTVPLSVSHASHNSYQFQ
jgi:hypothetical protein